MAHLGLFEVRTAALVCSASDNVDVPTTRAWQLNPSHSGVLQGLTEKEAYEMYGEEKVSWIRTDLRSADVSDASHADGSFMTCFGKVEVKHWRGSASWCSKIEHGIACNSCHWG